MKDFIPKFQLLGEKVVKNKVWEMNESVLGSSVLGEVTFRHEEEYKDTGTWNSSAWSREDYKIR